MTPTPIIFAGEQLLLDPAGAVFWPARRSLIVADLHLEKSSSYAARGMLLPPYDSRATLAILMRLARDYAPDRIIALGDSFHDSEGAGRLCAEERTALERIMARSGFIWISGNHDPLPPEGTLPGLSADLLKERALEFRHIATPHRAYSGEVSGHYHPKARVGTRGGTVSRRCFVVDSDRLLLPALGAYSGGLDVMAPPIRALFPRGADLFLLGNARLFAFRLQRAHMETA